MTMVVEIMKVMKPSCRRLSKAIRNAEDGSRTFYVEFVNLFFDNHRETLHLGYLEYCWQGKRCN